MAAIAAQKAKLKELGITADKIDEYLAAFQLFAGAGDKITVDHLNTLLNGKFQQEYKGDDLKYMLQQFNDSGDVDFFSFAKTLHEKMADPRYNEAFGDAFDLFDTSKTGELSKDDLKAGMMRLGETLTDAEAEEMLKVAKKKDDFVRAMSNAVAATAAGAAPAAGAAAAAAAPAAGGAGAPRPAGPGGPAGPAAAPGRPAGGPRPPGASPCPACFRWGLRVSMLFCAGCCGCAPV